MNVSAIAYLVMTNVCPTEWSGAIHAERQLVGRAGECPIRIPGRFASTSRRHAYVWGDARAIWVRDNGSTSGTQVNGVVLEPHYDFRISTGDRITLGSVELEVVASLEVVGRSYLDVLGDEEGMGDGEMSHENVDFRSAINALEPLTPAEREVVLWMCRGHTSLVELGAKLHRSPNTVRTHLNSIFRKLEVHSRDELIGYMRRRGDGSTIT